MSKELKRKGRPPGSAAPLEEQRKARSIRLNDARWEKLKLLGADWLEKAIDRAKNPVG